MRSSVELVRPLHEYGGGRRRRRHAAAVGSEAAGGREPLPPGSSPSETGGEPPAHTRALNAPQRQVLQTHTGHSGKGRGKSW